MGISAHRFTPLMPPIDRDLEALAVEVYRRSSALSEKLHSLVRPVVAELVEKMNCYYSNLIEGHRTRLADIDAAMAQRYSTDERQWRLQQLSVAHIHAEREMRARLVAMPDADICAPEFLCWLHGEFYSEVPEALCWAESPGGQRRRVVPGRMREAATDRVVVGEHHPPGHAELGAYLARFHEAYKVTKLAPVERVVAWAASHHRLAWIHPFLDGNGRVCRLFSTAYAIRLGIDGGGMWAISRGLARAESGDYKAMLAWADSARLGDYDGRGNLSESRLKEFCAFFMRTALDQIDFMSALFDIEGLKRRVEHFVGSEGKMRGLRPEAAKLLIAVLEKGEIERGEAPRISGLGERMARDLLGELISLKLLRPLSPKGRVRFAVPAFAAEYYFPRLFYPEESAGSGG